MSELSGCMDLFTVIQTVPDLLILRLWYGQYALQLVNALCLCMNWCCVCSHGFLCGRGGHVHLLQCFILYYNRVSDPMWCVWGNAGSKVKAMNVKNFCSNMNVYCNLTQSEILKFTSMAWSFYLWEITSWYLLRYWFFSEFTFTCCLHCILSKSFVKASKWMGHELLE